MRPRIQDRDRETLTMQKNGNNYSNNWIFRYNCQGFFRTRMGKLRMEN